MVSPHSKDTNYGPDKEKCTSSCPHLRKRNSEDTFHNSESVSWGEIRAVDSIEPISAKELSASKSQLSTKDCECDLVIEAVKKKIFILNILSPIISLA